LITKRLNAPHINKHTHTHTHTHTHIYSSLHTRLWGMPSTCDTASHTHTSNLPLAQASGVCLAHMRQSFKGTEIRQRTSCHRHGNASYLSTRSHVHSCPRL